MSPSPEISAAMLLAALLVPLLPSPLLLLLPLLLWTILLLLWKMPLLLSPLLIWLLLSLLLAGKLLRACLKGSSTLATISRACRSDAGSGKGPPGPDCCCEDEE